MKYKLPMLFFCVMQIFSLSAQNTDKKENAVSKKDSMRMAKLKAKGMYPVVKASPFSGVLPVAGINEKPDTASRCKIVISFALGSSEAEQAKDLNKGLAEIGRILNLHVVAGIPKENIDLVIVTHGKALYAILNNEAFKKQFKVDNPNLAIINELEHGGAKFVACGQAMSFLEIKNEELLPEVKIALAAKVALSTYLQKGYALFEIDQE